MLYPGRFAFPGHVVDLNKSSPFFHSELRKSARTEPCKQVPSKDLKDIEDVGEDAVPSVTGTGYVTGAAKYSQLGVAAAEEILKKVFEGAQLESLRAVLLIDLNPRVGDFAHAFCKLRAHLGGNTSLFYLAIGEKSKDLEWMRLTLLEELVEKAKSGQFVVPGMQPYQAEVNADLLEALPTLPVMNLLVTSGEGEFKKLQVPHTLVKKWRADEEYGDEFGKWLDNFVEHYSITEEQTDTKSPTKSTSGGVATVVEPSPKKLKVEEVGPDYIVKNDAIQETLLFDCKVSGKESMSFQIRSGKKLYLVNTTGQELSMKAMSALVGFGRGSFKLFKVEEALPDKAVLFDMSKPGALVCLNGQVMSVADCVHQQRSKNPEAQVSYHDTTMVADTTGQYTFKLAKPVAFMPADKASKGGEKSEKNAEESAIVASNIAVKEAPGLYDGLHCCSLVWWVRWTVKGLQPVKPMIHLNKKLVLPVGQGCKLTV